jgi:hypothetical protein
VSLYNKLTVMFSLMHGALERLLLFISTNIEVGGKAYDYRDSAATYLHWLQVNAALIKSELFSKHMELTTVLVFY